MKVLNQLIGEMFARSVFVLVEERRMAMAGLSVVLDSGKSAWGCHEFKLMYHSA